MTSTVYSSGRAPRRSRAEWHEMFSADRERGLSGLGIARLRGVGSSFVYDVLNDPDGSKLRARRERYRRPCPQCGTLMSGAEGLGPKAPRLCVSCHEQEQRDSRYWTQDRIVRAVRRWAKKHGRPPRVEDWRHANFPEWPACTACYGRLNGNPSAVFVNWADVVEAAGFARPRPGVREWSAAQRRAQGASKSRAGVLWSKAAIVRAIRAWADEHGEPPKSTEWLHATTRTPAANTVQRKFGTWNKAIRAAGFTPRRSHIVVKRESR